jgi:hypothetical protein
MNRASKNSPPAIQRLRGPPGIRAKPRIRVWAAESAGLSEVRIDLCSAYGAFMFISSFVARNGARSSCCQAELQEPVSSALGTVRETLLANREPGNLSNLSRFAQRQHVPKIGENSEFATPHRNLADTYSSVD